MGKKNSKQAWISREGPEGDCVVESDSANLAPNLTDEPQEKSSCTADFTYKGYPVNVLQDGSCEPEKDFCKKYSYYDYPIEVVELPDEPDGKKLEVYFEREGQVEASTQTARPAVMTSSECGQSLKSVASDRQEWSYTLYDFEGQGHVTREDLKSLVKSIYEVLGKNISRPKSSQREPVKKVCVRLSVSKERNRDGADKAKQECLLTAAREQPRKSKASRCLSIDREGSMIVNPPSTDYLSQIRPQSSLLEATQTEGYACKGAHHRRSSSFRLRCGQRQTYERVFSKNETRKDPVDSKGMYHYPKRMQTGPGECNPPASGSNEVTGVKDWVNQWCCMYEKGEEESTNDQPRHKHKIHRRHRVCQPDTCEASCRLRRCPQYLDLATDHLTYPYHTESQSFAFGNGSPRPQHHHKHSEHHCRQSCSKDNGACYHDGKPVIHQHHHHHNHHHYHHYVG